MITTEVFFDEKQNENDWLSKIREDKKNGEITFQKYQELLKILETDKPEPLEMEHFYFGLGLWSAGLVISVICLLAEIIVNYISKRSNRDVPISTPDLEVEHNSNVDDIEDTEV